ncbi:MAG TPA: helix-hairpin-helix domain-containing protein, partial [Gaiellaceae bacterium]|nr:helix-hairpin-helix domain-containing protein [Gaiellaceae bacterium]
ATPAPVAELVAQGRVRELRGIGPGIETRLRELMETGTIAELAQLEAELQPDLVGLGRLLGLTPRRMLAIARTLGISSASQLREAAASGRLQEVPGVGPETERRILAALAAGPRLRRGLTLNRSRSLLQTLADAVGGEMAGEPRRFCELSTRLAVVAAAENPEPLLAAFEAHALIVTVVERSARRALGVTLEGLPVELVVAEPHRFGTELIRLTGSPAYVEALEPLPDGPDEASVYRALGVAWRPPELRERPIAAAPPPLVEPADLRGDLHCHTSWSDGKATVREMADAADARGYEYLAICDHTPNVRVVPGLRAEDLRRQALEIAAVNEALAPFRVLRGVECDLRSDGSLDVDDATLATLDWVQLSLHAGQRRPRAELTRIVCEAMRHPQVSALSHPTGRILNRRPENALDLEAVFETALETGVALEVNGLPDRLDLSSAHVAEAVAAGVDLVLSSDAHSIQGLANVELAVATARRGGAAAASVVNTRSLAGLLSRRR